MKAAIIETLVNKANFETNVAVAIAEAMDLAIANAEVVTVPILDSRLARIFGEFQAFRAEVAAKLGALEERFDAKLGSLEERFDAKLGSLEAGIDAKLRSLEAGIDAKLGSLKAGIDAKLVALEARIDAKFARAETRQILWTLTIVVGNSYLPQMAHAVSAAIRAFISP